VSEIVLFVREYLASLFLSWALSLSAELVFEAIGSAMLTAREGA